MRPLGACLPAALAAVCLVGCGGGSYSSPKATVTTMWEAAKAGNKDGVMACYSRDCREKLAEMEKLLSDLPKELADIARSKQRSVTDEMMAQAKKSKLEFGAQKIDGDKATLEVITDGKKTTMEFVKEDGTWKVHNTALAALDMQHVKTGIELIKSMPKGLIPGLKKGLQGTK